MRRIFGLLVVVALVGLGYYFRTDVAALIAGSSPDVVAETSATPTPGCLALTTEPEPENLHIGVVIDPTASTASSFTKNVISALAAQISLPDKPRSPQDGVATINALNLRIKQVGSNPYAYGALDTYLQIPGVQGLPPRPGVECMDSGTYQQWVQWERTWSTQYDAAILAVETATKSLTTMKLDDGSSGIRAALSALAAAMPGGEHTAYLVASDFEENVKPQTAGTLAGRPLILIAACPSGDAATCTSQVEAFGTWAVNSLDAPTPEVFRPENMTTAIAQVFRGAES